jgi:hypothetical protein
MLKTHTHTHTQILISIQGLVLVPEPYYNEAGYEKQIGTLEGRHKSREYNESALLLTMKHMINTLTNKLPPFEGLITQHFTHRKDAILRRCARILDETDNGLRCNGAATATATAVAAAGNTGGSNIQQSDHSSDAKTGVVDASRSQDNEPAHGYESSGGDHSSGGQTQDDLVGVSGPNSREIAGAVGENLAGEEARGWADRSVPEKASVCATVDLHESVCV